MYQWRTIITTFFDRRVEIVHGEKPEDNLSFLNENYVNVE